MTDFAQYRVVRQHAQRFGATGLIFERNVWQRDHDESLRFVDRLREILTKYPTP